MIHISYILFAAALIGSLDAQEVPTAQEKLKIEFEQLDKENAEYRNKLRSQDKFENLQVEELVNLVEPHESNAKKTFEEAQLDTIKHLIERREKIADYFSNAKSEKKGDSFRVAILGNSSNNIEENGFNNEILIELLQNIKTKNPSALFFLGNLVSSIKTKEKIKSTDLGEEKSITGQMIFHLAGKYDAVDFQKDLAVFNKIVRDILGSEIPFYPINGEMESLSSNSIDIFKENFNLNQSEILDTNQLAYTVAINNSLFTLVSTDYFDRTQNTPVERILTPTMLAWLQKSLNPSPSPRFKFVFGNDPAFSTKATFNIEEGLDKSFEERESFWRLLKSENVLAYFCSNELIYDRSFRNGVWQIITGGAGSSRDFEDNFENTFYHYILLTIPLGKGNPVLEVYDNHGVRKDRVELEAAPYPFFNYRITGNYSFPQVEEDEK